MFVFVVYKSIIVTSIILEFLFLFVLFPVPSPEPLFLVAEAIALKNMPPSGSDALRRVVIYALMASISASTSCCERVVVKVVAVLDELGEL
mmetsp:Transcript_30662/g.44992  ORF Transcript_30662/g.44992 Transcript_30662/m.44992 type:complete len:91 (-) Transcript_30662:129-401(-)